MTRMHLRTRRDLLVRGHSDTSIRQAVRRGSLRPIAPGCFVAATEYEALDADDRYRLLVRAEAMRSPELVVSDISAAALWELPLLDIDATRVHFIRLARGGQCRSARRHVRSVSLGDVATTRHRGVVVTTPAQTVVDLARWAYETTAIAAGDAALHQGLVSPEDIIDRLPSIWNCKGAPAARLTLPRLDGRSESPAESRLRLVLEDGGLTGFALQVVITDEFGEFVGRSDFGFLGRGVLIEFDGEAKYGDRPAEALLREKRRRDRLTELGWLVVTVMWDDFADEVRLLGRIERALRQQRGSTTRGGAKPLPPVQVRIPEILLPKSIHDDIEARRIRRRIEGSR